MKFYTIQYINAWEDAKRRGFIDIDIKIYNYPFTKNKYTER